MANKLLKDSDLYGAWPPATSGVSDTSGTENPVITAETVGAGNILQVHHIKVRNKTTTATTVRVIDTEGDEIFAEYLDANAAFTYNVPLELPAGRGISLELSGANAHHWSILSRTRDE